MKKPILILLSVILASSILSAQLKRGSFGIQTKVDVINLAAPAGVTFNGLGVAYGLQDNLRIDASLGFGSLSSGGVTSSQFGIAAGASYYLGTVDNMSAFAGGKLGFTSYSPGGGATSQTGFTIGGFYGGEYWFSPKFSWAGSIGLDFTSVSVSGGNSTSIFSTTQAAIGLTWWFN
jgi:hypothetical protein